MKLLISRPAPVSSTSDSATSTTINAFNVRRERGPAPWRPPSRNASLAIAEARSAGINPNNSPVATAMATVNATTGRSSVT